MSKAVQRLRGKRVLITGASSGLGEQIAYESARRGAVVIAAARREDRLLAVQENAVSSNDAGLAMFWMWRPDAGI